MNKNDSRISEAEGHGPAMRVLTAKQRAFVRAIVQYGGNQTLAARIAGYAGNRRTLKTAGSKLARSPKVLAALREEASKVLCSHAIAAVRVIAEIAEDHNVAPRDRLWAAAELLNRGGIEPNPKT